MSNPNREAEIVAERAALMRYVIGRELAGVDDQAKLLAVINALGMTAAAFERRIEDYTRLEKRRVRSMLLRLDRVDEHHVVKAMAAYENRNGGRGWELQTSNVNGATLAGICIEWMGPGKWLGETRE